MGRCYSIRSSEARPSTQPPQSPSSQSSHFHTRVAQHTKARQGLLHDGAGDVDFPGPPCRRVLSCADRGM
eukprot:2145641-Rhodomonas_salina.1